MPFPDSLDTKALFDMPGKMTKVFDADLVFAGVATRDSKGKIHKRDAHGRTLDIHALRHSFCTMVAQSGVNMQTAQRLMRHASPAMTARYTHLTLRDLGNAIAKLPALPEPLQRAVVTAAEKAPTSRPLQRPHFSRTSMQKGAISCTMDSHDKGEMQTPKNSKTPNVSGGFNMVGDTGLEPAIELGQCVDREGTSCGHSDLTFCSTYNYTGHIGEHSGHQKDTLANNSCCLCVANSELKAIIEAWSDVPPEIQKSIVTIVVATRIKREDENRETPATSD